MPAPTGLLSNLVFVAILIGLCGALITGVRHTAPAEQRRLHTRRAAGLLLLYVAVTGALIGSGVLLVAPPITFGFFAVTLAAGVALALSAAGTRLTSLPLWLLVAAQGFRLPLELVLHDWAAAGAIPERMTWTGQNIDIVAGLIALAAAPLVPHTKAAAWFATLAGLALLMNVAYAAITSAPGPFHLAGVTPELRVLVSLPHGWIVPICVTGALSAHLITLRALLARPQASASSEPSP